MPIYNLPHDSYNSFRSAVIGKGFDVDGSYGYQCYDGCAVLWQQYGMTLSTGGTGMAYGIWTVESARIANAGEQFTLIYGKDQIQRGDVVVLNANQWSSAGHCAFADENYNGTNNLRLLGQNQENPSAEYGHVFTINNVDISSFLGVFRNKEWQKSPEPEPTPGLKRVDKFPWVLYQKRLKLRRIML